MKKLVAVLSVLIFVFSSGCARRTSKVQYGSITIDSAPQAADVSIDGVYRRKTPLNDYLLTIGKHTVALTAKAYRSLKKEISVSIDEKQYVDIASVESSRFTVVKETQNAYIIYGLIVMAP